MTEEVRSQKSEVRSQTSEGTCIRNSRPAAHCAGLKRPLSDRLHRLDVDDLPCVSASASRRTLPSMRAARGFGRIARLGRVHHDRDHVPEYAPAPNPLAIGTGTGIDGCCEARIATALATNRTAH